MNEDERMARKIITFLDDFIDKIHRLKAEFEKDLGEIKARKEDRQLEEEI